MSDIVIKLSRETLLEMLKQIPPDELATMTQELRAQTAALQQQLERARARVKPFSLEHSPFFSLPPVDIGPTSADEIDQIIADDAYRGR
ncbi:MAG: hypothetical protein HY314_12300 [Acidobacteria bacterium]|nr:hypothetical protein [Acidobacteriota bacterium]